MLSRKFVLLVVILVSLVAFAGNVSADVTPNPSMVGGDGNYDVQPGTPATYNWDQNPWLYFSLPTESLVYSVSWWNYTGDALKTPKLEISSGSGNIWHGFANFADWAAIRKAGNWTVRADYTMASGYGSTDEVLFRINAVPEPISSALFLLGGGVIAVLRLRKKKSV